MYMSLFTLEPQCRHDVPLTLEISFTADFKDDVKAQLVLSAKNNKKSVYWEGITLEHDMRITKMIPNHVLLEAPLQCYIFNPQKKAIRIDHLNYSVNEADVPSYIPDNLLITRSDSASGDFVFNKNDLHVFYSFEDKRLSLGDNSGLMTESVSLYLNDNQYDDWEMIATDANKVVFANENRHMLTSLMIRFADDNPTVRFEVSSIFLENTEISRLALILPFKDSDFVVYRTNMRVDSANLQNEYYLDHEGFSVKRDGRQLNLYHPGALSSIQLDAASRVAVINLDYEKDHPLIHYPAQTDTLEYYVDISKRRVQPGDRLTGSFDMCMTRCVDLPRIMPIWDGYESAFIFTEHADWTDIRTHRAICFGSEDVTEAGDAVGGFVHYGIPVTKSVFYCNPDGVRNLLKNHDFPGSHCTVKTDPEFFGFLQQLKGKGFDICLHTPEQYTATRDNLSEALAFMKENFGSPSWIDHGYNNTFVNNREDMVCDGLNPKSPYYALDAWKANGVRYMWNAAYEEQKPFEDWKFGSNLQRPYPFWSDAFPKPRLMRPPFDEDMILWTTEYTLEPGDLWSYYLSQGNLETVVESRNAFITHIYPAWVTTERGFWEVEGRKIVAKHGLNEALARIAKLRERHLMLPTTIDKYLHYQEQIQNVEYQYDNDGNVVLTNNNDDTIHGFSLISATPIDIRGTSLNINNRESNGEYVVWFDFAPNGTILIKQ